MRRGTIKYYLVFGCILASGPGTEVATARQDSWKQNWLVEEGFSIEIDTEGYEFPTAMAFVPDPGGAPDDPLYFVTELDGTIKVVTNDRTVRTFAHDFFDLVPPSGREQEMGMAAIALDPVHGYVFVSFVYQDEGGILRNNIARFDGEPRTFSLEPHGHTLFTEIFDGYFSGLSHQIGPVVVEDGHLYVGVGDAMRSFDAQDLDTVNGKILRMTFDGRPAPGNPFYVDQSVERARNFVWAYGFRNPFGLAFAEGRAFVSENGINLDRFVEVSRGGNYQWDGSDLSLAINSQLVFGDGVAPVELTWVGRDNILLPEAYRSRFFLALAGGRSSGLKRGSLKGVVSFEYDLTRSRITDRPRSFVRYRGPRIQQPVGVQVGPDGVYVVPLHPLQGERGAILKVAYAPDNAHSLVVDRPGDALGLMVEKGCYGCHGAHYTDVRPGPPLDATLVPRLVDQLGSREYIESVRGIDALDVEPYRSYREERRLVLEATGEESVRLWIKYFLMEPSFDRRTSAMPNPQLTEAGAEAIADYLVAHSPGAGGGRDLGRTGVRAFATKVLNRIGRMSPYPQYNIFLAGAVAGGGAMLVVALLLFRARRRRLG